MEIKENQNTRDWETKKVAKPTLRNVRSFQRQAKKLIEKGTYKVHIVIYTDDDPLFQEFYMNNGAIDKMF